MLLKLTQAPHDTDDLDHRVEALAGDLAPPVLPADRDRARKAWRLARARLVELRHELAEVAKRVRQGEFDSNVAAAEQAVEVASRKLQAAGEEYERAKFAEEKYFLETVGAALDAGARHTLVDVLNLVADALQPVEELRQFAASRQLALPRFLQALALVSSGLNNAGVLLAQLGGGDLFDRAEPAR